MKLTYSNFEYIAIMQDDKDSTGRMMKDNFECQRQCKDEFASLNILMQRKKKIWGTSVNRL